MNRKTMEEIEAESNKQGAIGAIKMITGIVVVFVNPIAGAGLIVSGAAQYHSSEKTYQALKKDTDSSDH